MTSIKLKGLSSEEIKALLPDGLTLLTWRGSVAHGTYVPPQAECGIDDKDIMGIYINPISHYLGFPQKEVYEKMQGEWDVVCYELRKMFGLLIKSNPNVLSMLWVPQELVIYENWIGREIRKNRDLFSSKKAYHSFSGYAFGQLKRMENFKHEGYMGDKRKSLVTKYGYDCKNAAHLIRLLRMGMEFLNEGKLFVRREDAKQLISIKNGEWTLEQVKIESDKLFQLTREAYIKSSLPDEPNVKDIENLLIRLLLDYYHLIQDRKFNTQSTAGAVLLVPDTPVGLGWR